MAYYQLQIHGVDQDDFDNILQEMQDMDLLGKVFTCSWYDQVDSAGFLQAQDEVQWISQDVDMMDLSSDFPDFVFRVSVVEQDNWHDYYQDGKCERCMIQIRYTKPLTMRWEQI